MQGKNKKVAIVGLGWLGEPLALALHRKKYEVRGTTTSLEKLTRLSKHPFYVGKINIERDQIIGDWETLIEEVEVLIINIPPRRVEDIETKYPAQIQQIIDRTASDVKVIFVSSTSIYGDYNVRVSEQDNPKPTKASGKAVLEAEERLKSHFKENVTILRLAGLIGPERHPGRFLANKRALKNPNVPVNLIHQEDCIQLIEKVLERDCFGETMNGCADEHPIRKDFYTRAAEQLNLEAPVFEDTEERNYKIVDNTKSKEILEMTYRYANPEQIFQTTNRPKIAIVGAGPGSIDLLTIKAFQLLQEADIILHDNLVSQEILDINSKGELIYVGRKFGDNSNQKDRQDNINKLLHRYSNQGKQVVRLKSGDPYIYGRAAEEARYLKKHQLPFEVIPGISAALAAANSNNIPITERQKSNAILICTAHTADYSFDQLKGIAELLKAGNTLALYMGLKSLDKLIPKLIEVCGDTTIPINAISNVSRTEEVLLTSTLGNIEEDIKKQPLKMPVVFLVGVEPITEE